MRLRSKQRDLGRQAQGFVVPRGVGGLFAHVGDARQPAAPGAVLGLGRRRHAQAGSPPGAEQDAAVRFDVVQPHRRLG